MWLHGYGVDGKLPPPRTPVARKELRLAQDYESLRADIALRHLDLALKSDPAAIVVFLERARIYEKAGNEELALKDLTSAIELAPNRGRLHGELADYLL